MGRLDILTPDQYTAVTDRGGALLVAAAAGSGKTRVLVERLLQRICDDKNPADIDKFLIITYTKAAAAELRGKIMEALGEKLAEEPGSYRLRRQQLLLGRAQIGTIHSFCTNVLRENAQLTGLAPDFRVADESEIDIIKQDAMDELLDRCYINPTEGFNGLLDATVPDEDDLPLQTLILRAYTALQSHPYPDEWCESTIDAVSLENVSDIGETAWGKILIADIRRRACIGRRELGEILDECAFDEQLSKALFASLTASCTSIDRLISALDSGIWDDARACAQIDAPRAGKLSKEYEEIKNKRKAALERFKKISAELSSDSATQISYARGAAPMLKTLLELVRQFGEIFTAHKRKKGIVDFSDMEHLTLNLVYDKESKKPSAAGRALSERFAEIMVDEYQDVNRVQELIIESVSKNGENRFMVGDVKQSIYRFRLADPGIFLEKYNSYRNASDAQPGEPRKVILSRNFRSREGILQGVNYVFANTMSKTLGDMNYTTAEYLYPGAVYPQSNEACIEVDVLDVKNTENIGGSTDPDSEDNDAIEEKKQQLEARFTARRIAELKNTLRIKNGDVTREAKWSDFAILLRSVTGCGKYYVRALNDEGIPVSSGKGGSFYDEPEISFMLSLLAVIDNPRQDIPLISVLRGPLFGFTPDELTDIRAAGRGDFYDALRIRAKTDKKCADFISQLDSLRSASREMSSDRLIWHIYNSTQLLGIYAAMSSGSDRRENLMHLFEMARGFEQKGYKGLFRFINAINEKLKSKKEEQEEENAASDNAVKLMTIHKSKGLEFPVVFMPDLTHRFNVQDENADVLLHRDLGPAARVIDQKRRIKYSTFIRDAEAKKIGMESRSEEMRLMYVGMTRAQEKLVMIAAYSDEFSAMQKAVSSYSSLPLEADILLEGKSYADWIVPVTSKRPEAMALRGINDLPAPIKTDGDKWTVAKYGWAELNDYLSGRCGEENLNHDSIEPEETVQNSEERDYREQIDRAIRQALQFRYPYEESENLPSKLSPTELKGRTGDEEAAEESGMLPKQIGRKMRAADIVRRPEFAPQEKLTGAERGTAFHRFMQYSNWTNCGDLSGAQNELDELIHSGRLTDEQAKTVDLNAVCKFFSSDVGNEILTADKLYREFKFSVLIPAQLYYDNAAKEDKILLQGVVDCCWEKDGELTILDFKTDKTAPDKLKEQAENYRGQLDAYKTAMESITGKNVIRRIVYFTHTGNAVQL